MARWLLREDVLNVSVTQHRVGRLGEEVTGNRFNDVSSVEPRESLIIINSAPARTSLFELYEGWNFNSGNYLFTTDTK